MTKRYPALVVVFVWCFSAIWTNSLTLQKWPKIAGIANKENEAPKNVSFKYGEWLPWFYHLFNTTCSQLKTLSPPTSRWLAITADALSVPRFCEPRVDVSRKMIVQLSAFQHKYSSLLPEQILIFRWKYNWHNTSFQREVNCKKIHCKQSIFLLTKVEVEEKHARARALFACHCLTTSSRVLACSHISSLGDTSRSARVRNKYTS